MGATQPASDAQTAVVVDEDSWQQELSRPAQLCVVGWMVSGNVVVGNHAGADVVIPENRSQPTQAFPARDYARLTVRGARAQMPCLDDQEASLLEGGRAVMASSDATTGLYVHRRDADGELDFTVALHLRATRMLPDPRARMLAMDDDDAMAMALFTLGLPLRHARTLHLGAFTVQALYDGQGVHLTDYLESYLQPDGTFLPCFVKHGDASFKTAPEDGSPILLAPGDHLMVGVTIYRFGNT
jgi:hypothetical protein